MNSPHPCRHPKALTLLEMTLVILILLTLIGVGMLSVGKISEWKLGREASEKLRQVYTAQRVYLSDHPTAKVSELTKDDIIPYLTNRGTSIPTVQSLEGITLNIKVNVSPPVVDNGSGSAYDPSGSSTDSLWDVGQ